MNVVSNMSIFSSQREILGLPICDLAWSEAYMFISALADMPVGQTVLAFANAHNLNIAQTDPDYRDCLSRQVILPDGLGVDIASLSLYGKPFPANLNGTDFVPALLTYMTRGKRIGLIGAAPDVLARARDGFARHAPWHEFIAISDGFLTEESTPEVIEEVARQKLDVLLVAMGTPKQEKWVDRWVRPEHARLVVTVGALFDFVAGEVPRAPMAVRRMRTEWLFRILQEPRRLWSRYFVGGPVFLGRIAGDAMRHRIRRAPEPIRIVGKPDRQPDALRQESRR